MGEDNLQFQYQCVVDVVTFELHCLRNPFLVRVKARLDWRTLSSPFWDYGLKTTAPRAETGNSHP